MGSGAVDRRDKVVKRTRGGWIPAGTSADRRETHQTNGTPRGRRTRRLIVDSARSVFERVGYLNATVDDIVTEAAVSRGTFYTYFSDKLEVFRVVTREVNEDISDAVRDAAGLGTTTERLARTNAAYIAAYRRHAAIVGLVEQLATIDDAIHEDRVRRRTENVARLSAQIRRWQANGLADPSVDPDLTAASLISMTSNLCYWWYVGGEEHDDAGAAAEVTANWVRLLGLRDRPRRSWLEQQTGSRGR